MEGCAETGSTGRIIEGLWSMDNRGKLTDTLHKIIEVKYQGIAAAVKKTSFAQVHIQTVSMHAVVKQSWTR
jgi:hypothetical protein